MTVLVKKAIENRMLNEFTRKRNYFPVMNVTTVPTRKEICADTRSLNILVKNNSNVLFVIQKPLNLQKKDTSAGTTRHITLPK